MPRHARIKDTYGTYYLSQYSNGCRPLFENNDDRQYFIDLLQRTVNKFNCRVLDYCAQDNHMYHLIIDVNGGDLSKIMKSINIAYAMHATCEGKLFKDRYKSTPVRDQAHLLEIRKTIQEAVVKTSGYSSFCVSEIQPCQGLEDTACKDCMATAEAVYDHISRVAQMNDLSAEALLKNKAKRNDLIKDIRRNSTLSLKSIGNIFGGLSESTICKILNQ